MVLEVMNCRLNLHLALSMNFLFSVFVKALAFTWTIYVYPGLGDTETRE